MNSTVENNLVSKFVLEQTVNEPSDLFGSKEQPILTVVVFPWERFSVSVLALESLLQNTTIPYKLIFVDGNSPRHIQQQIHQKLAARPNTTLLRYEHYLRPIQARNIGLQFVDTPYVAFVANDVYLYDYALQAMLRCAIEEKADAVTPVVLIGRPDTTVIHSAGGSVSLYDKNGQTWLNNNQKYEWQNLTEVSSTLKREPAALAELHCWLAKSESIRCTGDGEGNSDIHTHTFSQWDFGLIHQKLGMRMFFEPAAVTVYMSPFGLGAKTYDLPFFYSIWSERLAGGALYRLTEKHGISPSWPRKSRLLDWVGIHRRIPMDPLIDGTRAIFSSVGIPKAGTAIQKLIYQPTEVLFNQAFMSMVNPLNKSIYKAEKRGQFLHPNKLIVPQSEMSEIASVKDV